MFKLSSATVGFAIAALTNHISHAATWLNNPGELAKMTDAIQRFHNLQTSLTECLSRFNIVTAILAIDNELSNMSLREWQMIRQANELDDMLLPVLERRLREARQELWFSMGDNMRRQFHLA